MNFSSIFERNYTIVCRLIMCFLLVGAFSLNRVKAADSANAVNSNIEFAVPQGYRLVPEALWGKVFGSSESVLACFLPESDYSQVISGKASPVRSYRVSLSPFMKAKKPFGSSDFMRLRQLLQSGFFIEQNERLLHSRYEKSTTDDGVEVMFSSIYNQPENAVGYYSVEPELVLDNNVNKIVRVVYEVLIKGVLYEVELSDRRGDIEQACNEAGAYIKVFAGEEAHSEAGSWGNLIAGKQLFVSSGFPGLAAADFTFEYSGNWEVISDDASEKSLVSLRPRSGEGEFDSGITISVLPLPFTVSELSAEEIVDIAEMSFKNLKQSATEYERQECEINGMTAVIQRFLLTDSGMQGVVNWRRVCSIFSGRRVINFTADLYYDNSAAPAAVATEEKILQAQQEGIMNTLKLKK